MLTKRRLTVQPVDVAGFSGELVISFRNGADHVRPTPVPTEDAAEPLGSCVMVHAYGGAQCGEGWVSARQEYIRAVGVSTDGVVACRVSELPAGNPFSAAHAARSTREEKREKIVFFSGRHRLSEMLFTAVDEAALSGKGQLPRQEWSARYPALCLRLPHGQHVAVFACDKSSLTACVSHGDSWYGHESGIVLGDGDQGRRFVSMRNRERRVEFTGHTIACMGAGRPAVGLSSLRSSGDEVTLLLDDHTIVVYGGASAGGDGGDGFPTFDATLTCAFPAREPPTDAAPARLAWAGRRVLWIVYEDGTVCALRATVVSAPLTAARKSLNKETSPSTARDTQQSGEERTPEGHLPVLGEEGDVELEVAFIGKLTDAEGNASLARLFIQPDARTSSLHYCFSHNSTDPAAAATLFYGTVRLSAGGSAEAKGNESATQRGLRSQQRSLRFGECVYGIRYDCGRYHLLTQSCRGEGPLCITSLPRTAPTPPLPSATGEQPQQALSLRIMHDPEEKLGAYCRQVENEIRGINDRGGGTAAVEARLLLRSETDVTKALLRLQELKQCVYALLCREQQQLQLQEQDEGTTYCGGNISVTHSGIRRSYPQRLLQQLSRKYTEVSVYLLLLQLGCLDAGVEQPLHDALDLHTCRDNASAAQETLKAFITSTMFPASVQTDAVHAKLWPAKVTLCIDAILADLGFSSAFSLAQVLAEATGTASQSGGAGGVSPVLALLVLYYSYRRFFSVAATVAEGDENHQHQQHQQQQSSVPSRETQQRGNDIRHSFLAQCNLSATSLNAWAFASYAVDHGVNPTACSEEEEEEEEEGDQLRLRPLQEQPYLYVLGATISHLDAPPLLALLPALVNGLMDVFAMDTAHRLMATTLSVYGAGGDLPPALGLKLLFVALQAGADRDVETIFVRSRGTALEAVAAQALGLAVLRSGDVSSVRGLVKLGSPQERLVEATLASCEDVALRERVLLRFYVLMHRFSDALAVCEAIASRDGAEGQRVSTVASHLRSLLPHGNPSYMLATRYTSAAGATTGGSPVVPSSSSPPPPVSSGEMVAGRLGWASVAPTPLENSRAETEAQLRRAVEQFAVRGGNGGGNGPPSSSSAAAATAALYGVPFRASTSGTTAMRPSAILGSLDRTRSSTNSSSVVAATRQQPSAHRGSGNEEDAPGSSTPPAQDTTASFRDNAPSHVGNRQGQRFHGSHSGPVLGGADGNGSALGSGTTTCEAVLQRSGKVCGRARPCPYHDRR